MAKVLKLVGLVSYTSRAFKGTQVKRGETVRVTDTLADSLTEMKSMDRAQEDIDVFDELPGETVPTYDFSGEAPFVAVAAPEVQQAAPEVVAEPPAPVEQKADTPAKTKSAAGKPATARKPAAQRKTRTTS